MDFFHTSLGIEFGTTRIKAVLIGEDCQVLASGSCQWENRLVDGIWTYPLDEVHSGLQACYAALKRDVWEQYGVTLRRVGAIGISAMMHGYLPFDRDGRQLAEFRTWRNTITGPAAAALTGLFHFRMPQRWTIAHLYQAVLNGEEHVKDIHYLTTLAGYVHWRLSSRREAGLGEASGIVPLDRDGEDYDGSMLDAFDRLVAAKDYPWRLSDIIPRPVKAGENSGCLTEEGALLLDPEGDLESGIPLAPCEGDASTGLVATNAVRPGLGSVSAGTSAFIMLVTDRLLGIHRGVDVLRTPNGLPVAMVHSSNCTSDVNAWVTLLEEFVSLLGPVPDREKLYGLLFSKALEGEPDAGGLLSFNYFSGEGVLGLDRGRPLFVRRPDSRLTLANFMRCHLLSALATMKLGLDSLRADEALPVDRIYAQGGFFRTPGVGQMLLSTAVNAPVTLLETAGEGGPYGMALLGAYMVWRQSGETLEDYLDRRVFAGAAQHTLMAGPEDVEGMARYVRDLERALPIQRMATELL